MEKVDLDRAVEQIKMYELCDPHHPAYGRNTGIDADQYAVAIMNIGQRLIVRAGDFRYGDVSDQVGVLEEMKGMAEALLPALRKAEQKEKEAEIQRRNK